MTKQLQKFSLTGSAVLLSVGLAFAQNPGIQAVAQAIQQAASDLQAFFEPVTTLLYVVAAITGLFGGYKIYSKMQNGDQDVQKSAVGWVGAVLFLLSIAAVLQAVFFT